MADANTAVEKDSNKPAKELKGSKDNQQRGGDRDMPEEPKMRNEHDNRFNYNDRRGGRDNREAGGRSYFANKGRGGDRDNRDRGVDAEHWGRGRGSDRDNDNRDRRDDRESRDNRDRRDDRDNRDNRDYRDNRDNRDDRDSRDDRQYGRGRGGVTRGRYLQQVIAFITNNILYLLNAPSFTPFFTEYCCIL